MIQAFKNIWRIPELRLRVLFTLAMLAVYRVGAHIPTPGIDSSAWLAFFEQQKGGIRGFGEVFSGGAGARLRIGARGSRQVMRASSIRHVLHGERP